MSKHRFSKFLFHSFVILFQAIDEEDEEEEEGFRMKIDTDPEVIDIEEAVRDELMEQRKLDKLK